MFPDHVHLETPSSPCCREATADLERNTAIGRVLEEETAVDLALIKRRLLETSVGNVRGTSRLLEHAAVVLAATRKVSGDGAGDLLEGTLALAVEDGNLATMNVSTVFRYHCKALFQINLLLDVVESHGKVLPVGEVNGGSPKLLVGAVENLEAALVGIALANEGSGLELDLVVAEISGLVPHVQVLVGQVQGPLRILLDTPVEGLDALTTLAIGSILEKLELSATESDLLHEDGCIRDGELKRLEAAIEARGPNVWELENLRPGQVVALDEASVEEGVGSSGIERLESGVERNTAIENDGALGNSAT